MPAEEPISPSDPATMQVRLLGGFEVRVGERTVPAGAWRLAKARAIVKLLALASGHALHRDEVIDALWPEMDPGAASNNFHRTLHAARRALAEIGAAAALRLTGARLTLCPPGPLWVDVEAFARAAAAARTSGDPAACEAALALYAGDLLPEDRYEDWAAGRREALRGEWLGLLGRLARLEEERGRYRAAIAALETLVVAEPADEAAHVGLMRLYALTGERQRALAQYGQLRTALHRDLDAEPDPATERLYRAVLRGEFPPPGAVPGAEPSPPSELGGNLPTLLTSFVDRERERAELKALLGPDGPSRLVTLIGPAGAGKTRLAVAAASEQSREFPGGAWFVGLAPLTSGEAIPGEIARTLGVREPADVDLVEALVVALRARPTLLVLDNCEHLIEPAARLALLLLRRVPDLRVLATSREALHAPGESLRRIGPLPVPEPIPEVVQTPEVEVETLLASPAVRLLVERARLVHPDFALTSANAHLVVEICRRLEGMPLALELAAARLSVLTLEEVVARLDRTLALLSSGRRGVDPRHETLRGTLDWSHSLLTHEEAILFRRLAVFRGGWTLDAAEAICADDALPVEGVVGVLADLANKSLVGVDVAGEQARYRFLEVVRQYAEERLERAGEDQTLRQRHATYFSRLAIAADGPLCGSGQESWLARLEADYSNLRVAMDHLAAAGVVETVLEMARGMWRFWWLRGYLSEGRERLRRALEPEETRRYPRARMIALFGLARLCYELGDAAHATAFLLESQDLARRLDDDEYLSATHTQLGHVASSLHQFADARRHYEEALAIRRRSSDRRDLAVSLVSLGELSLDEGAYGEAERLLTESLSLFRQQGDLREISHCLGCLGAVALRLGDPVSARRLLLEALEHARAIGHRQGAAAMLGRLADVALAQGERDAARDLLGESLRLYREVGFAHEAAACEERLQRLATG